MWSAPGVPVGFCDERSPSHSSFCGPPPIPPGINAPIAPMPPAGMPGIDIVRVPTSTP